MGKVIYGVFNNKEIKYCSKCGRQAVYHYELNRGYGSQFDNCDGHICSFDLCEDCHEEWIEEVVSETPIVEDFSTIYPNEYKLVEFIETFPQTSQDLIYYGYNTYCLTSEYNAYFNSIHSSREE